MVASSRCHHSPHPNSANRTRGACSFTPIQGCCFAFWKGWNADTGRTLQDRNTAGSLRYSTPQKLSRPALTRKRTPLHSHPSLARAKACLHTVTAGLVRNWHISPAWFGGLSTGQCTSVGMYFHSISKLKTNKAQLYTVVTLIYCQSKPSEDWEPPPAALLPPALKPKNVSASFVRDTMPCTSRQCCNPSASQAVDKSMDTTKREGDK